jgi:hypothetical protein
LRCGLQKGRRTRESQFSFLSLFSELKAGLDAAPVAGQTAGDIVMMLQDATFYLIDHSPTWNHRDISDVIV